MTEALKELQPIAERTIGLAVEEGLDALNPQEQTVFLVWSYGAEVANGGHAQFFFNTVGGYAPETVDALNIIGATEFASLLGTVVSLFSGGLVPRDLEERNQALTQLPDSADQVLESVDDRFFELGADDALLELLLSYWRSSGCT